MSAWKVALATVVIFMAGLITGGVGVRLLTHRPSPSPPREELPPLPTMARAEFLDRMGERLHLTTEQREKITKIVHESQERIKNNYQKFAPQMHEEIQKTHEAIRAVLTPEQQKKYEEFASHERPHNPEMRPREGTHHPFREEEPGNRPERPPFFPDNHRDDGGRPPLQQRPENEKKSQD